EAVALILGELKNLYEQKEIDFPVAVGMSRFLSEQGGGEKYDREGLANWANGRFQTHLPADSFRGKAREEIESVLKSGSGIFPSNGGRAKVIDEYLDGAYGERNGEDTRLAPVKHPEPIQDLVKWANEELKSNVEAEDLLPPPREEARRKLVDAVDTRYRPELREAERALVLEVLDTAWKDHRYYMDHLRHGISLMGYAQKDPTDE